MPNKINIEICLGSSCFARGNKQLVQDIKAFIEQNQCAHKVNFRGKHCFGICDKGPNLKVNETIFEHVDKQKLIEILEKALGKNNE
jgi:NADH:ubiquinone oxidoreductase subunit E